MLRLTMHVRNLVLLAVMAWFTAAAGIAATVHDLPPVEAPYAYLPVPAPEPAITAPAEFRAIYISYWSAATPSRVEAVLELAREGLINAVVIDVKDVTGTVAFDTRVPAASEIGAKRVIIRDVEGLLGRFHEAGLYVIARIVVFTDPKLAEAQPGWAVHSAAKLETTGGVRGVETLWRDRRNLAWIDPGAIEAWNYNIDIALDALSRGFDEVNFDYIRFPSDGALSDMKFPIWDGSIERHDVVRAFFKYLRREMGPAVISADLFGLSTVNRDDLGIGQMIEDAMEHFDYVCPMVYPSHYAPGFIGKANPAEFPYEVVYYSMKTAGERLGSLPAAFEPAAYQEEDPPPHRVAKLRPWLQDFDLGANYTPEMVEAQVRATRDSLGEAYCGFVLWNPRNVYQRDALEMMKP